MNDLHIPNETLRWLDPEMYETDEDCRDEARQIAAPVVAAELRRLLHEPHPGTLAEALRDRLAELEGWA